MQYLIEKLSVICDSSGRVTTGQDWHSTHNTMAEANQEIEALQADAKTLAIVLLAWEPGRLDPTRRVQHGSASSRGCAGGVPTQVIVSHFERPIVREVFAKGSLAGFCLGNWCEMTESKGKSMTTQPPPGFKLRPEVQIAGPDITIIAGLRATTYRNMDVPLPILALIPGEGWKQFDSIHAN